jgi:site-specific recombinase XerD
MITLLERRASPVLEGVASAWSRQGQAPSILRDGTTYDANLDRFLADLPINGVRSQHSIRSYAYDVLVWVRFLDEVRGKTVWQATREDVDHFHRARRYDDATNRVSASSWNRAVAALDKLYRWAVEDGIMSQIPFAYRDVWRRMPSGRARAITVTRNQAYERAAKRSDIKFITMEDYCRFRDVGLRGLAVDGSDRPGARDRNGTRNALFAELLLETGLRLEEASSLLACEVEEVIAAANGDKQVAFPLAAALTKGNRGRTIRIPAKLLAGLRRYLEDQRPNSVEKFQARRGLQRMRGAIIVGTNGRMIEIRSKDGSRAALRLDNVTPDERRRLVLCDSSGKALEPAAFWLSEIGLPVAPNSWEAVFARASRRCQDNDLAIDVSPHQLRHSFAVHKLEQLIRQRFRNVSINDDPSGAAYRRLLGDPLQQVQRLLGHSSLATTYIYLSHAVDSYDTVDTAVEELLADIKSRSALKVST